MDDILLAFIFGVIAIWLCYRGIIAIYKREFIFSAAWGDRVYYEQRIKKSLPPAPKWTGWPGVLVGIIFLAFSFIFFSIAYSFLQ